MTRIVIPKWETGDRDLDALLDSVYLAEPLDTTTYLVLADYLEEKDDARWIQCRKRVAFQQSFVFEGDRFRFRTSDQTMPFCLALEMAKINKRLIHTMPNTENYRTLISVLRVYCIGIAFSTHDIQLDDRESQLIRDHPTSAIHSRLVGMTGVMVRLECRAILRQELARHRWTGKRDPDGICRLCEELTEKWITFEKQWDEANQ